MAKINVLRSGCFVDKGNGFVELEVGEQEVSEAVAQSLCQNKSAIAIEEKKVASKAK